MDPFIGYIYFINQLTPARMKKKIVVFRFGSHTPTKSDAIAVIEKLGADVEAGELLGCPMPGGMATIIHTDKSVADVVQAFKEAEIENEDTLPIIVLDEGSLEGLSLETMGFEAFAGMMKAYDKEYGKPDGLRCTLSLDELLDIVNQVGINGLDQAQLTRLKELSSQG